MKRPNIVVVVSDTLRTSHMGCYGNKTIHTPNLDAFANQGVQFNRAYPESLPTIPVRRALHTGRRAYPFRNYRPVKWDIVYLPGWQALDNEEDTVAETLADEGGYHTGFVTDTLPYFAPGFNFQRGFWQWEFIRGQQQDYWQSPHTLSDSQLGRYGDPAELRRGNLNTSSIARHAANIAHVKHEEDTTTARTFQWAMNFLEDNRNAQPFYLFVDCFDPHEPWEAPPMYYNMYGNSKYRGPLIVYAHYGPVQEAGYKPEEIENIKAHYSGLVTLVDTWFGKLIDKLRCLDLLQNTAVLFISDHGTNFCENPRKVIGKPHDSMYPGLMHLPLLVHLPQANALGMNCNELVYNIDLTATIYDLAGVSSPQGIDGQSLLPLITGEGQWRDRKYITCRYDHNLCYIDDKYWVLTDIDGHSQEIFDLESDVICMKDITNKVSSEVFRRAWERLLADANAQFPDYRQFKPTDAIGRPLLPYYYR